MPAASYDRNEVLETSSAELASDLENVEDHARGMDLSWGQKLLLLALNYLPFLQVVCLALVILLPTTFIGWRMLAGVALIYLVPPVLARLLLLCRPPRQECLTIGSKGFFTWWALLNLQVIFCRLPALEEILRLVPGLYSAWLRLWGARIGRLTYWAPGTRILDRPFLEIGDDVILGAGVRINAHVLARKPGGSLELLLSSIHIGDRALIGGYSLLTAGSQVAPDETTRAFLILPPFSKWKNGKRIKDHEPVG